MFRDIICSMDIVKADFDHVVSPGDVQVARTAATRSPAELYDQRESLADVEHSSLHHVR